MTSFELSSATLEWSIGLTLALSISSLIALVHWFQSKAKWDYLSSLPWVGVRNEWFSKTRAEYRAISNMESSIRQGHDQYSKKNQAFAQPFFNNDPFVVLPPSTLKTLVSFPDRVLDTAVLQHEQAQPHYTLSSLIAHDILKFEGVKKQMSRKLLTVTEDIQEELADGFDTHWGQNADQFTPINVLETVTDMVSQAANKALIGQELCRNKDYLQAVRGAQDSVFQAAQYITMFPSFMRPLAGRLIAWWKNAPMKACGKHLAPIVEDRLRNLARAKENPDFEWTPPSDALQWTIETTIQKNRPEELDPMILAARMLFLNIVAIHTTSFAAANVLLDLFSLPDPKEAVAALQEEIEAVLESSGGVWNKDMLGEMHKVDSAIRESMRCSDQTSMILERMVMSDTPLDFGHGITIPKGIRVAVSPQAVHHDESAYPDAYMYKPFRFVHDSSPNSPASPTKPETDLGHTKNLSITATDDKFLYFGHGRHACPGRFFAAQVIKLFLCHVVLNYDVEKLAVKPAGVSTNQLNDMDHRATIQVRRRR